MGRSSFVENWIRLALKCVRFVSYSVVLDGQPKGCIIPTRGLHQGDPLSPFLFLFCMEGLSALLRIAL